MLTMTPEIASKIRESSPIFYEGINFDCGPGWAKILLGLGRAVEQYDLGAQALQVKEKFGTLRVYVGGMSNKAAFIAVDAAENVSATTCERCGEAGILFTEGWLRTLCAKCEFDRATVKAAAAQRTG